MEELRKVYSNVATDDSKEFSRIYVNFWQEIIWQTFSTSRITLIGFFFLCNQPSFYPAFFFSESQKKSHED